MRKRPLWRRLLIIGLGSLILSLGSPNLLSQESSQEPPDFEQAVERAVAAREAGRFDEAVKWYRRALQLDSSWAEGWRSLGTLWMEQGKPNEALGPLRRAVALNPKLGPARILLGLCQFETRRYSEALTSLTRGLDMTPLPTSNDLRYIAQFRAGLLLTRQGRYALGEKAISDLIPARRPTDDVLLGLGLSLLELPYLPSELPSDYRQKVLLTGRAQGAFLLGDRTAAESHFSELVDRYPDQPKVHYLYAEFLSAAQPVEALEQYRLELQHSPDHLEAKLQIGLISSELGRVEEGLPFVAEAVRDYPRSVEARTAYGRLLLIEGRTDEAIEQLETGLDLAPNYRELLLALQRAYARAGRDEDAKRIRERFLDLMAE